MKKITLLCSAGLILTACASSTSPTKIGGDTYFSSKPNRAGIFGDPTGVAGTLIAEGNNFCATQGKEFELVTQNVTPVVAGSSAGGASITFKCTVLSKDVRMRPEANVRIEQSK